MQTELNASTLNAWSVWALVSQEEELVAQFQRGFLVEVLSYQVGKFVCVLTGCGHPDGSWPVVVQVSQFVGQPVVIKDNNHNI